MLNKWLMNKNKRKSDPANHCLLSHSGAAANLSGFADLGSHAGHPHLRSLTWAARFVGTSTASSSSSVLSILNATSAMKPSPILQQERSLLLSPQECVCASHSCSMSKAPSPEFSAWHVRWPGIWFLSPAPRQGLLSGNLLSNYTPVSCLL